jgi:hypothetical protein
MDNYFARYCVYLSTTLMQITILARDFGTWALCRHKRHEGVGIKARGGLQSIRNIWVYPDIFITETKENTCIFDFS